MFPKKRKPKSNKPISKQILDVNKKHLTISKEQLTVNKEQRELQKKQVNESLTKKELRFWNASNVIIATLSIIVIILLGTRISDILRHNDSVPIEPSIHIQVTPYEVMENQKGNLKFIFNFTNDGKYNLSQFEIYSIDFYRIEKGEPVFLRNVIDRFNHRIDCYGLKDYSYPPKFTVGETCTVTVDFWDCQTCFDDKDKTPQFFIYMKSNPLIKNEVVNLSIY